MFAVNRHGLNERQKMHKLNVSRETLILWGK